MVAPFPGTVTFAGTVVDRPVLTVQRADGLRASFEPVASLVSIGTRVRAGEPVATVAVGSHCAQVCLHWGLRWGERYLDPLRSLLMGRYAVLLPWAEP